MSSHKLPKASDARAMSEINLLENFQKKVERSILECILRGDSELTVDGDRLNKLPKFRDELLALGYKLEESHYSNYVRITWA